MKFPFDVIARACFRGWLLVIGLAALVGCATPCRPLVDASQLAVSSVLVSADQRFLVFLGPRHHYVIDAPELVVKTLQESFRPAVTARLGVMHVKLDGSLRMGFLLVLEGALSPDQEARALRLGYQRGADGLLRHEGSFTGQRYAAGAPVRTTDANLVELKQTYAVEVRSEEAGACAAPVPDRPSPVKHGLRDALFILTLPLFPLGIPMAILCEGGDACNR